MTATTAADWLAPQRAALDRRQARLEEVFGTLDVPDGASVAVVNDVTIVVPESPPPMSHPRKL